MKLGPDYNRLKIMVKKSIEQEIRNKNFGARSEKLEKNALVKNQGTKQRVQRILGDCRQWETHWQYVKENNCSFRHDMNKRGESSPSIRLRIPSCGRMSENHRGPEIPEVRVQVVACHDDLARIALEELAITHFVKNGTLQNACSTRPRVVVGLGKSARSQLVTRSDNKLGQNSSKRRFSDARQLGGVFKDMTPPIRKSTDMPKPIQRVKFTKGYCTSYQNSRSKSSVQLHLSRCTS